VNSLHGGLDIVAGLDDRGVTILRRQSFSAPVHLSKPHHDEGWLVVNMASPTSGLLAGDRVEVRVAVEPGARLLLTAPSASRIHTMTTGHAASAARRAKATSWLAGAASTRSRSSIQRG
jgi:urease accessory protein